MRIGIFVQQLEYMGGIERVVLEHLRIFAAQGCEITLFTNRTVKIFADRVACPVVVLPQELAARAAALKAALVERKPEVMIFHGVSDETGKPDVRVANELGIKTVCVIHFAFTGNIASFGAGNSWKSFRENGAACTAFATVCRLDALFWRALGMRAFHVQNPFVHPTDLSNSTLSPSLHGHQSQQEQTSTVNLNLQPQPPLHGHQSQQEQTSTVNLNLQPQPPLHGHQSQPVRLIWVGRMTEQKQPDLALKVFELVEKECPNVRLTMVGGQKSETRGNVEIVSEKPDIGAYWAEADIHLLTSAWESFCLVWAEAKAAGLPTAMFALPYLELAEDTRGYVAAEQGDVRGLADAVIRLVKDPQLRARMGAEAKESLARFNDEAVWQSWRTLFDQLDDPKAGTEIDPNFRMFASNVYSALCYNKANNRWTDQFAEDWQKLARFGFRPIARMVHRLVEALVRIKSRW